VAETLHVLGLYGRLVAARIRSQLQYRLSFAIQVVATFFISFLDFVAILILFENVPALGEWSVAEVALLYGVSTIAFSFADLAVGHLDEFPQLIRDGTFDLLLIRPRGTLFQVVASDFQLRRLGKTIQGLVVLGYALSAVGVDWSPGRIGMLVLMIVAGTVIFVSVWVIAITVVFWTVEGGEFANAFTYGGQFLAQYPIDIYGRWLRRFLAFVVPMAFVAYFPALYVLDKPDPLGLPGFLRFSSPVVAILTAGVAGLAWRFAVRHYRSAGG